MNRGFRLFYTLVFTVFIFCSITICGSASAEESPIRVEADHMTSMEKDSSVIFTGEVDAQQDDVRIRSDKMTVYYTEKVKEKKSDVKVSQKVEKLVCNGNVEITRNDWLGTSKDMVYLSKERQIILIGDAKAWQGQNMVSGDKIIYYLDEGRSEVVADRTSATMSSKEKKDKKSKRVNMTILQQ